METKITPTTSKLSLLLTFTLAKDRPGIIETIVNILSKLGWNIERCWSGESSIILSDDVNGMLRVSKMFTEKVKKASLGSIESDIKSKVEVALNEGHSEKTIISVTELNPNNRFRFAAQIEIADRRGVVKDVLRTIYQPGIYADKKEVFFRLEGLLFLPIHVGEGKGHYIMDARFWALEGETSISASASNIADANISEREICERISTLLKTTSGVRRWNILATHQRTRAIIDQNDLDDKYKNHIYKKLESIAFEGKFYGAFPGTAYAVAEEIFNQGYTIERAIISESPEGREKRHLGIFWGEPDLTLPGADKYPPTPAVITDAIERHREKIQQQSENSDRRRFTSNIKDHSYTTDPKKAKEDPKLIYSPHLWISCQIEIEYEPQHLSNILAILTDSRNPTGKPLNIEHFINLFLYNKNRDNHNSADKNVLVEFLCSSTSNETKNDDILAENLNTWLFDKIWNLKGVLSVSSKPVRTYGRTLGARFGSRSPIGASPQALQTQDTLHTAYIFPPTLPDGVEKWEPEFQGTITSLADMLNITNELQTSQGEDEKRRLYYRGERRIFEDLIPSLVVATRKSGNKLFDAHGVDNLLDLQLKLLQNFQRYVAKYRFDASVQHPENFIEWLCLTQHHTLPTLLLDWSSNPLVSLFFAFDDPCGTDQDKDGQIWIMRLKAKKYSDPYTIYLGNEVVEIGYKNLGGTLGLTSQNGKVSDLAVDQNPLLIVPRILTKRIEVQSGHFIFSNLRVGLNKMEEKDGFSTLWEIPLLRYLVPSCCKDLIREEIRNLQIHEGTMYGDLDAYARFLRNGGL